MIARPSSAWAPERRVLTLGMLGLVTAVAFEGMAVPTVLPATVGDLGGLELYGWAFSAFWLTNIIGITLGGAEADRRGPGLPFALGVALFAGGIVVAGLAGAMPVVITGRAIQGLGSGAIGAVVYAVIARAYAQQAIPRLIALISSAWVVPGLIGPAIAGSVADTFGWRWVFLGIVPPLLLMGLAVLPPLAGLRAASTGEAASRSDGRRALDALLLAIGSTLVLAALALGDPLPALALGVPGAWLAIRSLRPLLPPGSLRARAGRPAVVAIIFGVAFAFFGTEAFVPLAAVEVRGTSTTVGGLALTAAALTWTGGSWLQARLAPRGWRRPLVGGGSALIAAGIGVGALVLLPVTPVAVAALGWAIAGLGMGLAYSTLSLLVLESADPGQEGTSSAALQLMFTLGTALGAGVGGAVIAIGEATAIGVAQAIAIVDGIMLLVALGTAALAGRVPAGAPGVAPHPPAPVHAAAVVLPPVEEV